MEKLRALNAEIQVLPAATSPEQLRAWEASFKAPGAKKISALLATKWDDKEDGFNPLMRSSIVIMLSKLKTGEASSFKGTLLNVDEHKAFEFCLGVLKWLLQSHGSRGWVCMDG